VQPLFHSLFARLAQWFADPTNGIPDLFVRRVHTQEICTTRSDGSEVCASADQLAAILTGVSSGASPKGGSEAPATAPASALLFQRRTAPLRRRKLSAMTVQRQLLIPPRLPRRHQQPKRCPHPQTQRTTTLLRSQLPQQAPNRPLNPRSHPHAFSIFGLAGWATLRITSWSP
jgi:hypothetical protein